MENIISLKIYFSSLIRDLLLYNLHQYLKQLNEFTTETYNKGLYIQSNTNQDAKAMIKEYESTLNNNTNASNGIITSSEFLSSILSLSFEVTYTNSQSIFFIENTLKLTSKIVYYTISKIVEIDIISSSMEYKAKANGKEINIAQISNKQLIHISIDDIEKRYQHIYFHLNHLCSLIEAKEFPVSYKLNSQ